MHRGAELVNAGPDEAGRKLMHVCDFHAWTYGSDGRRRARSHRRFVLPRIPFIPDPPTYSAPLFLKRQCDRALGKLLGVPEEYGFEGADDGSGNAMERGGLTELHCAEKAGLLFVIASPCSEEAAAAHFDAVMPPDLEAELSEYNIGKHHRAIEQTFGIAANWKLPIDTFGETYHFQSLHPQLREALVPNCSTFKSFGGLGSHASRFTLAQQSVDLMGSGAIPKQKWAQPSSLSHLLPAYHLGPNLVMVLNGGDRLTFSQFWPGESVGQCVGATATARRVQLQ
jgi:hypothetical protein